MAYDLWRMNWRLGAEDAMIPYTKVSLLPDLNIEASSPCSGLLSLILLFISSL